MADYTFGSLPFPHPLHNSSDMCTRCFIKHPYYLFFPFVISGRCSRRANLARKVGCFNIRFPHHNMLFIAIAFNFSMAWTQNTSSWGPRPPHQFSPGPSSIIKIIVRIWSLRRLSTIQNKTWIFLLPAIGPIFDQNLFFALHRTIFVPWEAFRIS